MDWNEEWNTSIRLTSRERLNSGPFWDGQLNGGSKGIFWNELTDDQLKIIGPRPDQKILEIGPGEGRLTVPMARSAGELTVVDPSAKMLERLRERVRVEGVGNVRFVSDRWERTDTGALGAHQKLVSSFSLFMYGLREQMERMSSVSEEVYLFAPAEHRIPFEVQKMLFGEVEVKHTDHEILSNIARDLGLRPRTSILEYAGGASFDSFGEAADHYLDMYGVASPKKEEVLDYLASEIKMNGDKFSLSTSRKVGAIWWRKD